MKFFEFAAPITNPDDEAYRVPCVVAAELSGLAATLTKEQILGIALCLYEYAADTGKPSDSAWFTHGLQGALR